MTQQIEAERVEAMADTLDFLDLPAYAALLRRLQAEIERLRAVPEGRLDEIADELEKRFGLDGWGFARMTELAAELRTIAAAPVSTDGKTTVWIVGRVDESNNDVWFFQGVFRTRGEAVNACRDFTYFVGPARVDESLPYENVEWEGAFYPITSETIDRAMQAEGGKGVGR